MSYVENAEYPNTYLYRAIVPAQTIASGSTLLEVYGVNGGKNYTFKLLKIKMWNIYKAYTSEWK